MVKKALVYWHGIVGIAGKGPNYITDYNPSMTIGQLIASMTNCGYCGERNKRIEIFKFERGNVSKYDKNNPYWSHNTTLSEYLNIMGREPSDDIMLIYVNV